MFSNARILFITTTQLQHAYLLLSYLKFASLAASVGPVVEIIKLMDDSLKMFKILISGDIELSLLLCLIILIMSSIDQLQHRVVAIVRCLRSRRV